MTPPLDLALCLVAAVVAALGIREMITLEWFKQEPPKVRREWRG